MKYTVFLMLFFCVFSLANEKNNETSEGRNPNDRFLPPEAEKLHNFLEKNKGTDMELYQDTEDDGSIEVYVRPVAKPPTVEQLNSPPPQEIQYDFCNSPRQTIIKTSILQLLNQPCEAVTLEDLKRITSLPLDNLNIDHLSRSDFYGLTNVTMISLYNNRLKEIPPGAFDHLPSLTYLDLSHNQIDQINTQALNSINRLSYLDLSHNLLRELPNLDNFHQLAHLDLSHNLLRGISENIFNSEPNPGVRVEPSATWGNLITLDLSYNEIKDVASNALNSLHNLVNLDLSHNQIARLSHEVFANLPHLVNLNLAYNQITELGSGIFSQLYSLVMLNVSHNELNSLEWSALEGLNSLEVLKYSSNPLEQIIINPQRDLYKTGIDREWYDCLFTSCWNNYAYIAINKTKYKYMKCRGNDSDSRCHHLAEAWKQDLDEGYFLAVELKHNGQQIESVQRYEFPFDME